MKKTLFGLLLIFSFQTCFSAVTDSVKLNEMSIEEILAAINSRVQTTATEKNNYVDCTKYGMMWTFKGATFNLAKLSSIPNYSNTVKNSNGISVIDYTVKSGYYGLKLHNTFDKDARILVQFKAKQDAVDVYELLLQLRELTTKNASNTFDKFDVSRWGTNTSYNNTISNLKKSFKTINTAIVKNALKGSVGKKKDCFHISEIIKVQFLDDREKDKFFYSITSYNQKVSDFEYAVKNIEDFHAFLDEYYFNFKDIETIWVDNKNGNSNASLDFNCPVGEIWVTFTKDAVSSTNKNRYSNIDARKMGYSVYTASSETKTGKVLFYFENTGSDSGKKIAEAFQMLAATE